MKGLLCAAAMVMLAQTASAAVLLQLAPNVKTTAPGGVPDVTCDNGTLQCLIFAGTITADPGADTFLNAVQITFAPVNGLLASIDLFFFDNVPGLLLSSDSPYVGPIFALDVAPGIAAGTYNGTAALLGGATPSALGTLATASFQVIVTPEPATWMQLGCALVGLAGLAARRRGNGPVGARRQ